MTPSEINALILWVRMNRERIGANTDELLKALDLAREFQCRRATGQPVRYTGVGPEAVTTVGPGPHGGPVTCKEH
jgi:hypothetical protein